jgi:hypothetical protein
MVVRIAVGWLGAAGWVMEDPLDIGGHEPKVARRRDIRCT